MKGFPPWPGFSVSVCPSGREILGRVRLRATDPMEPHTILTLLLFPERLPCSDRRPEAIAGDLPPVADAISREAPPGPELDGDADEVLPDAVRNRRTTICQPVGSVAMGDAASAPLDADCRLH